jgi:hypothetical protein
MLISRILSEYPDLRKDGTDDIDLRIAKKGSFRRESHGEA